MITGIILAGGASRRMKKNKMLLDFKGKPMIMQTINHMRPFVDRIIVVTGYYHDDIAGRLQDVDDVTVIFNPRHRLGMFSSVLAGIKEVESDVFIVPGDCPMVSDKTYRSLLRGTKDIRVPTYQERRGHPLFVDAHIVSKLKHESPLSTLKKFRNRFEFEEIPTHDHGILKDIDTPKDYKKILEDEESDQ